MNLNGKKFPLLLGGLLSFVGAWALWPESKVIVAVSADFPAELVQQWSKLVSFQWVEDGGRCDLRLTTQLPVRSAWARIPANKQPPTFRGPGGWRAEFSRAGAHAVGATAWVWRVGGDLAGLRPLPETEAQIQGLQVRGLRPERVPWAKSRGQTVFLPTDLRRMQWLWVEPCAEFVFNGRWEQAALWFYSLPAQNAVVGVGYYSPWSKMVDPNGVRPFQELALTPLASDD